MNSNEEILEKLKSSFEEDFLYVVKRDEKEICKIRIKPLVGKDLIRVSKIFKGIIIPITKHGEDDFDKAIEMIPDEILPLLKDVLVDNIKSSIERPTAMKEVEYNAIIHEYVSADMMGLAQKIVDANFGGLIKMMRMMSSDERPQNIGNKLKQTFKKDQQIKDNKEIKLVKQ